MDEAKQGQNQQQAQKPASGSLSMMMFLFLFMMLFLFNPGMRETAGSAAGGLFYPLYGFGGAYPQLTIFCAGVTMVILTTTIRHMFMDWIKMADIQAKMKAFNKKLSEYRKTGNFEKMQKVSERHKPELMRMQLELQGFQMKPMILTMMVAIPIFMWLHQFVDDIPSGARSVSLPWESKWWLDNQFIFPYWIGMHMLFTIPIGQAYQRALKMYSFKKRIGVEEGTRHIKANQQMDLCTLALDKLAEDNILFKEGQKNLKKAEEQIAAKKFLEATELCEEIISSIDFLKKEHLEAMKEIDVAEEIIKREAGLSLEGAENNLQDARDDFERGEYSSALFYARKAKRIVKELSEMQSEKDKLLVELRKDLENVKTEFPDINLEKVKERMVEAEKSKDGDIISENVDQARREIKKAKRYLQDARELEGKLEKMLKRVEETRVKHPEKEDVLKELEEHFQEKDYHSYLKKGEALMATLEEKIEKKEELLSNISHSELLIKNALNFGADMEKANRLRLEAKQAFENDDDEKATSLVKQTMDEVERAKEAAKKYSS